MTMTKTMPGVLEFPSNYQMMDAEEMTYVEGGKWKNIYTGSVDEAISRINTVKGANLAIVVAGGLAAFLVTGELATLGFSSLAAAAASSADNLRDAGRQAQEIKRQYGGSRRVTLRADQIALLYTYDAEVILA